MPLLFNECSFSIYLPWYHSEHWWVYSFLDWSQGPRASIWYIAVSVIVILCYFLQLAIHATRDWIASKCSKTGSAPNLGTIQEDDGASTIAGSEQLYHDEKLQKGDVANQDNRYYSQTLVESSLDSHITLGASSTEFLAVPTKYE